MKIAVLQHEAGETAGFFETVWREQKVTARILPLYETQEIPALQETHLLIMGGSMSVHDEQDFPFLRQEKRLIREYVKRNLPVLGICLGAQLIADAFGGRVYPYRKELGWTLITGSDTSPPVPLPSQFYAFQLHGDTFDLPSGATLLCTGKEVRNQALSVGSALGLQFHMEMTAPMIENWTRDSGVREKKQIRSDTARFLPSSNMLCRKIGEWFLHQ
ncbi:MAG: type 1 glutamine amidotransferase [Methanomicrobiales archaeon]|nr:type 1 glutamine amidotransferase [Methanomicrobiales archaeon]